MGRLVNLAELASDGVMDVPGARHEPGSAYAVPLAKLVSNPENPRDGLGDLTELSEGLAQVQLQPCAVVTRTAFLSRFPEHAATVGTADYVVVNGNRRLAAARLGGLAALDVVVKDQIAESRESLAVAAIEENIARRDFDVLEEAAAVAALVKVCGSATEAARRLHKSKGWVSQRQALLKLSEPMKEELKSGRMTVRDGRRLGALPAAEQERSWKRVQPAQTPPVETPEVYPVNAPTAAPETAPAAPAAPAAPVAPVAPVAPEEPFTSSGELTVTAGTPAALAAQLRRWLSPTDLQRLVRLLG